MTRLGALYYSPPVAAQTNRESCAVVSAVILTLGVAAVTSVASVAYGVLLAAPPICDVPGISTG